MDVAMGGGRFDPGTKALLDWMGVVGLLQGLTEKQR